MSIFQPNWQYIKRHLRTKYRVECVKEKTLEQVACYNISLSKLLTVSLVVFSLTFMGIFFLIAYSPVKGYLPGYDSEKLHKQIVQNSILVDSLHKVYDRNKKYIASLRSLLAGNAKNSRIIKQGKATRTTENDKKKTINVTEKKANNTVEPARKKNKTEQNQVFYIPVKGKIVRPFSHKNNHPAVDISVKKNTPIVSIAKGEVIFAEWTSETAYVIIIDHGNGLKSVYKHNAKLVKKKGDIVAAGETISRAGDSDIHFEMWLEKQVLNPELFFNF